MNDPETPGTYPNHPFSYSQELDTTPTDITPTDTTPTDITHTDITPTDITFPSSLCKDILQTNFPHPDQTQSKHPLATNRNNIETAPLFTQSYNHSAGYINQFHEDSNHCDLDYSYSEPNSYGLNNLDDDSSDLLDLEKIIATVNPCVLLNKANKENLVDLNSEHISEVEDVKSESNYRSELHSTNVHFDSFGLNNKNNMN